MFPLRRLRPYSHAAAACRKVNATTTNTISTNNATTLKPIASRFHSSPSSATSSSFASFRHPTSSCYRPLIARLDVRQFSATTTEEDTSQHSILNATENEDAPDVTTTTIASPSSSSKRLEIEALLKTEEKVATDQAIRLFQELSSHYSQNEESTTIEKPESALLETLLESLLLHGDDDPKATALQAQNLVTEMEQLYQQQSETATTDSSKDDLLEVRPSVICLGHLIEAWSLASSSDQAERVFWEMIHPQRLSQQLSSTSSSSLSSKALRAHLGKGLNLVLQAHADVGAGKRCDAFLTKLGRVQHLPKGIVISPNPESYHAVIRAWQTSTHIATTTTTASSGENNNTANAESPNNNNMLPPTEIVKAARRVEALVDFLIKRYEATDKNSQWLPQLEIFPWLFRALELAGAPPPRSQKLLTQLIQEEDRAHTTGHEPRVPPPTTHMYNQVLYAWASQGRPAEAAKLLSQWTTRCQQTQVENRKVCRPDRTSCHLVIRGWGQFADHKNAPRAELLLEKMKGNGPIEGAAATSQSESDDTLHIWPSPTVETYNAVLEAWSRSRHYKIVRAITNADRILDTMHDHNGPIDRDHPTAPNSRSYEIVIETYARFGHKGFHRKQKSMKLLRQMKHYSITPSERCLELIDLCQNDDRSLDEIEEEEQLMAGQQ